MRLGSIILSAVLVLIGAAVTQARWTVELSYDATATIRYNGASVVKFKYVAWGPNWAYADVKTTLGERSGETWPFSGEIQKLNARFDGQFVSAGETLTATYTLDVQQPSTGNMGGGMQFDLRLDPQVFGSTFGKPEIIDNGAGFAWTPVTGQTVKVTFENLAAPVYFERGDASKPRAFFIPANLTPGRRVTKMTIQLPPGGERIDGAGKFYGKQDERTWVPNTLNWQVSPIDLSYLNDKPAGGRGFVKAVGDRLEFEDGTEARFWGCNVMAYAIFNAKNDAIEQQAKRIAALGYNLVRLHHHDSADWSPSVFVKDADNTRTLDAAALDRIDYWVKCLKDQGVYVWLDLHTGRPFRPGDGIPGYNELTNGKSGKQGKGASYINETITQRMKEFADAYLTRTNRYTGLKYTEEPAIMGVLITNENDLTRHFGTNFLPDKGRPYHQKIFDDIKGRIVKERGLDGSMAWKTWLPGPSKVVLNEIEYNWASDFVRHLRSIGLKAPIAVGNTWGAMPLSSLPSLTAGDLLDVHSYGMAESLNSNPRYDDMSTHWIAAGQVANMPVTITEWNTEYPQRDRFTQPMFMAATAAFQGWDAPMIYGYQQSPLVPMSRLEAFSSASDPSITSLMPAAALIFRQQLVSPAKKTITFGMPGDSLLLTDVHAENSPALRTFSERHRLTIALPKTPLLPWLDKPAQADVTDPMAIVAEGFDDEKIVSDTGQLTRYYKDGYFTINAPAAQAAMGWIGGKKIELDDVTFEIDTPKATVGIVAMDGKPLAESKKMLVSFAAQSVMMGRPSTIRTEPVTGRITLKNANATVQALSPILRPPADMPAENGVIILGPRLFSHWLIVTRP